MTCLRRLFFILTLAVILPLIYMVVNCRADKSPASPPPSRAAENTRATIIKSYPRYLRDEQRTYLTFPEWFIVYISEDYGTFLKNNQPSAFPYLSSALDFWTCYCGLTKVTSAQYQTSWEAHLMIFVIGVSHTLEYIVKGIYENTIGRLFEWLSTDIKTAEDHFAEQTAAEYGIFLNTTPWYEFPFYEKLTKLWNLEEETGSSTARKWERKVVLTLEYGFKSIYGGLIKLATGALYEPAPETITMITSKLEEPFLIDHPEIRLDEHLDDNRSLITLPRYAKFTRLMAVLAENNVTIHEIAGNDEILVTYQLEAGKKLKSDGAVELFSMNLPLKPAWARKGARVELSKFSAVWQQLKATGGIYEHSYDY